jgi:hypothetical protein
MPSSSDQTRGGRRLTLGGGAESSLEGRDIELSVSPKDIRTSPDDLCANRSDRRQSREGDQWFESTSLQQRVRNELLSTRHEPPARISSTASHPLLESALAWAFNPEIAQERVVVRSKAARHKR